MGLRTIRRSIRETSAKKNSDTTTGCCRSVRGTLWESNPGDVSTDLPEPMLIIPQLPDVEPAPTKTVSQ